ncbi:pilus assembly protein [Trinickia terrae]|uniref:Pilus assembly protein n=1 Tax=Trinickia terrae TaxID=2571161 RepID=A0A4U1HX14_9BURK|nr:type II secretion system F family protein [Trinickia terrae]TKC86255.1 pilus assembly protein [Trinickia terrae]
MSVADLVAIGAFFMIVVGGLIVLSLLDLSRNRPEARVRERMRRLAASQQQRKKTVRQKKAKGVALFNLERDSNRIAVWFRRYVARVRAVGGPRGPYFIVAALCAGFLAALVAGALANLPGVLAVPLAIAASALAARMTHRFLVQRFRARFLEAFPDAIDLIVRAVRAGIPVVQAIGTVGHEAEEPVRSAFRTMGDGLLLGADLKEVLTQAGERLQIADFSFFMVYLLMQRETGGSLGETLEELSEIIRARRDIRVKTRALTAEGRITTQIISVIPFVLAGFLYLVNRPYTMLLFETRAGHKILAVSAVMLVIGLTLIRKIARLDTSR